MKPLAALQAGTLNGAKLLGWQDQIGALKPGYFADVIAVPGDPLADIESDVSWFRHPTFAARPMAPLERGALSNRAWP